MSEHEVSRVVQAPPAQVFDVVADPARLPEWLPTVESVEQHGDGGIALHGEAGPHQDDYGSGGFWRPSPEQLRVEWSTPSTAGAPSSYAGWLQVADSGQDGSEVTVHLSFTDPGTAPPDVEGGLTQALVSLAGMVET